MAGFISCHLFTATRLQPFCTGLYHNILLRSGCQAPVRGVPLLVSYDRVA